MLAGPGVDEIAEALRRGEVVAIPTDTVYGLAVDARLAGGAEQVFALKRRPDSVALPVLVGTAAQAAELAAPGARAALALLAAELWPGPITFVVERSPIVGLHLGGDPGTVGLRCPRHRLARGLCSAVGPLAVTSANRHGGAPCVTAREVWELFGDDVAVLDGGRCSGEPSTVVSLVGTAPALLREGPVPLARVEAVLASGPAPSGRAPAR